MLTQVFPEKPGQYGVSVRDEICLLFFLVLWGHSRSSLCLLEGKGRGGEGRGGEGRKGRRGEEREGERNRSGEGGKYHVLNTSLNFT